VQTSLRRRALLRRYSRRSSAPGSAASIAAAEAGDFSQGVQLDRRCSYMTLGLRRLPLMRRARMID
jgi:hypothetical protein